MKNIFVIVLFALVSVAAWARPDDEEHYSVDLETIDVPEILGNPRLFDNYFNCFTNKGNCPPIGKKIKEILPDALHNKCSKCTEVQKKKSLEVVKFLAKNRPEKFLELEKIYDKERKYRANFAKELATEGITLPE